MSGVYAFPRREPVAKAAATTSRIPVAGRGAPSVALSEIFAAAGAEAGAVTFALSGLTTAGGPLLWIQDRLSRQETGQPYLPGLGHSRSLLRLTLTRPADVLTAAEEGLRCKALSAVVAEIWSDPPVVDFTATKRLVLRAETMGVPCWLIRHGAVPGLSAARDRWRITSLPSSANPDDIRAPGAPRWRVELFRSRDKRPGVWVARHDRGEDGTEDRVDLVAAVSDGALDTAGRAGGQRATR